MNGRTLAREHDPGAEIEPWPQHRVCQIGARLVEGADTVKPGRRGSTETRQLRKDKPHPVTLLSTRAQFGEHGLEDRGLRGHEALQIEGIGRRHLEFSFFTRLARPGGDWRCKLDSG